MGAGTVVISLSVFFCVQLGQGIMLNSYLFAKIKPNTTDPNQWFWLIADGVLFLYGAVWILAHMKGAAKKDIFGYIPPLPFFWSTYLALCLVPRISWLFAEAGTRIDCQSDNFSLPLDVLQSPVAVNLGSNTLLTILALFTTTMMVMLAVAGYGQHGFDLQGAGALDFDIAEAALSIIDGVEFLQGFFDVSDCQSGTAPVLSLSKNATLNAHIASSSQGPICVSGSSQAEHISQCYLEAIEGTLGSVIIALACLTFTLPVFALWQMRRRSDVQQMGAALKSTARRSASMGSKLDLSAPQGTPTLPRSTALSMKQSTLPRSISSSPLTPSDKENTLTMSHSSLTLDRLSTSLEMFSAEDYEREKEKLRALKRELKFFEITYILWDCFLINLAGFIVRVLIWTAYQQQISALITKNLLVVIFRSNTILTSYLIPWYRRKFGKKDDDVVFGLASNSVAVPSINIESPLSKESTWTGSSPRQTYLSAVNPLAQVTEKESSAGFPRSLTEEDLISS